MPEDRPKSLRSDPEWQTDFGPPAGRVRRLIYALICIAVVFGFLGVVLATGGTPKSKPATIDTDIPTWALFTPFTFLLLAIALYAERVALWIQKKAGWSNQEDED